MRKVRAGQIARIEKMRAARDEAKVARGAGRAGRRAPRRRVANLLDT